MTVLESPPGTHWTLRTEHAVAGGRCLARVEGKIVLVAGALPGETVRVRVTRDEKRFAEADVVEVVEAHPERRDPPCPYAAECGGCDFQHATPSLQREMKRSIVIDAFRRIARLDVESILDGPADGPEFRYRRRIRLSTDPAGRSGLLRRGSHEVVPIDDCLLMVPAFADVVLPWLRLAPPWKRAGVRVDSSGDSVVLFETGDPPNEKDRRRYGNITKAMERPETIRGLLADGVPLSGARELSFRVRDRELRADATSFFQGNETATEELVNAVERFLGDGRGTLVDLYAGVGLFSACLGDGFERIVAVESDRRAARHLKRNLKRFGSRVRILAESAEVALRTLPAGTDETVVIDPPRVGLSKEARERLAARAPARIVSVSCDPATAARDTASLVAAGYTLEHLRVIDMFPVTAHIETVALFVRGDARGVGAA